MGVMATEDVNRIDDIEISLMSMVEFANPCHDSSSGRFCDVPGAGDDAPKGKEEKKRGEGGKDEDQPEDGDQALPGYNEAGKPIAGHDAWLEAHGLTRKVFDQRPYARFEKDRNDPVILEEYGDDPKSLAHFKRVAGSTSGYVMKRNAAPESPYGKIPGEVKPDEKYVLNPGEQAKQKAKLTTEQKRLAQVEQFTGKDLIKDREVKLQRAEENLKKAKDATPETVRAEAQDRLSKAQRDLGKAKASGNEATIKEAQSEFNRAKRGVGRAERLAKHWRPEKEIYDAETAAKNAQKRLDNARQDPERALGYEVQGAKLRVKRAQNAYEKTAIKYAFAPGPGASRLDVHPDALNVKNLTSGKGRVYWSMEGVIKADAIMTAAKKEDLTASVVSNPSVTLWQNEESRSWFPQKYLKGREVVIVPDADGVTNPDVVRQAKGLQAALQNAGAGRVLIAAAPLTKRGGIEKIRLPSGAFDERKGVDDHLGAGKGSLGQLTFTEQTLPPIDLSSYTRAGGRTGPDKINRNAVESREKALRAVSSIVGSKGSAKIPKGTLANAAGLPETTALESARQLDRLGVIKIEHVFDPHALSRRRRIQVMSDERVSQLVKAKVIKQPRTDEPYTDIDYDESPVITLLDKKYLAKETKPQSLSSIDTWKPPKSYKGWVSPVTRSREAGRFSSPPKLRTVRSDRVVRSPEGAKRYGVPIGSPIPVAAALTNTEMFATGVDLLSMVKVELYNKAHDPSSGRFGEAVGGTVKEKSQRGAEGRREQRGEQQEKGSHDDRLQKLAIALGAVAITAGLAYVASTRLRNTAEKTLIAKVKAGTERRALSGGKTSAVVELVTGPKGRVIHKTGITRDTADSEYLAGRVGRALKAPVPQVARINDSELAIDHVDGVMSGNIGRGLDRVIPVDRGARAQLVKRAGSKELGMLDIAIRNQDRHGGNILIGSKSLHGIDHGTAFQGHRVMRAATPFESHWKGRFTKAEYARARRQIRSQRSEFERLGRLDWFDDMDKRLATLEQKATA